MSRRILTSLIVLLAGVIIPIKGGAATQYWDTAVSAGIDGGDGVWSTNQAKWADSAAGTNANPWVPGNYAFFNPSIGGTSSTVTVTQSLAVGAIQMTGSGYTLMITNSGALLSGSLGSAIGSNGANNTVILQPGPGGTVAWEVGTTSAAKPLVIGVVNGSSNNTVRIDGAGVAGGARMTGVGVLSIGAPGSFNNKLMVTNGGTLSTFETFLGFSISNQAWVVGGGPAGAPAIWDVSGSNITLGSGGTSAGSYNRLVVDGNGVSGGALVTNLGTLSLGNGGGQMDNRVSIRNGGQMFANKVTLSYNAGFGHLVEVVGGGAAVSRLEVATQVSSQTRSMLLVDGAGAPGSAFLRSGANLSANSGFGSVIVSNGGQAVVYSIQVGSGNSNSVIITDPGSTVTVTAAGASVVAANVNQTNNQLRVSNSGSLISAGSLTVGNYSGAAGNNLTVNSAGTATFAAGVTVGNQAATGNYVLVTGAGSTLSLQNQTLQVGGNVAGCSNNFLTIDQGGTVDGVGTLTVISNNQVNLLGGLLGVATTTYTNGPFQAGDGTQEAVLKSLGGTLTFSAGLTMASNATLTGAGTVSGGTAAGVTLTNGAVLAPGFGGIGSLTIGGSGLNWGRGGILRCEITNLSKGPASGWDLATVSGTLALGETNLVVRMDSMGTTPAGFDPARNYFLRILNPGSVSGYQASRFTVETNAFAAGTVPWGVTNANRSLWLTYQPVVPVYTPSSTWNAPNSGNWDVSGNWVPGGQPVNDGTAVLEFGGTGTAYASTNNLGVFSLNQLLLTGSGSGSVTNWIAGSQLVFTNEGAALVQSGIESYLITNPIRAATSLVVEGDGFGTVSFTSSVVTANGGLLKRGGPWTMELYAPSTFGGPLVLDAPDSVLKCYTNTALGTTNRVIVSNGTLNVRAAVALIFSSSANRKGLITGPQSVFTGTSGGGLFYVATGVTNVELVVSDGALLQILTPFQIGNNAASYNRLIVTNGGRFLSSGTSYIGNSSSSGANTLLVTGPTSLWNANNSILYVGNAGNGNRVIADNGGTATNIGEMIMVNGAGGIIIATNGGRIFASLLTGQNGANTSQGRMLVTGPNSLIKLGGDSKIVRLGYAGFNQTITAADGGTFSGAAFSIAEGGYSTNNSVTVTSGGRVLLTGATLISTNNCTNNAIRILGAGSTWNCGGASLLVAIGANGRFNNLTVEDGGILTNVNILNLSHANALGSISNYVSVKDGKLQAATLTASNAFPQYAVFSGASTVTLNNLIATNLVVYHNGGTLSLKNATVQNGTPFVAGGFDTFLVDTDGVAKVAQLASAQPAALNLLPGGRASFFDGLVVTNLASLTGSGTLAATTTVFGALSPGTAGVGGITNSGDFTLAPGAATTIELAAATGPGLGWDLLAVTNGALQVSGSTLTVLLANGYSPTNLPAYVIMTNQSGTAVSGSFANLSGGVISAYTNIGGKAVGQFQVVIAGGSVTLENYAAFRSNPGSLIVIR